MRKIAMAIVFVFAVSVMVVGLVGCSRHGEHPSKEHPTTEHPE